MKESLLKQVEILDKLLQEVVLNLQKDELDEDVQKKLNTKLTNVNKYLASIKKKSEFKVSKGISLEK